MSPFDSQSPAVRHAPLRGEKLSEDSPEDKGLLRKSVLYAVSASLILWAALGLVIARIF